MGIVDEDNFLTEEERKTYEKLLSRYGYKPTDFVLEVTEDQEIMDMNDMTYIVMVKVQATSIKTKKAKIYESVAESKNWLKEFEEDLMDEYFL